MSSRGSCRFPYKTVKAVANNLRPGSILGFLGLTGTTYNYPTVQTVIVRCSSISA